jgi:similar to stage IV sporulation protein
MGKIANRIRGEARVEIFGVSPENLVNRSASVGVTLRSIVAADGQTIRCSADEKDLETLRALAQRCQCELRLLSLRGGSRYRRLLRRRVWLPLTAAFMAALLLVSSLFVWDVEIYGADALGRGKIMRALAAAGVERGCFWPALSADLVRSRALAELPELAWLTVNVNGSRAVVLAVPREQKPEIYRESEACSLAASRSGIVRRVSVLNGRALVQPGQAVQEGEILIGGRLDSLTGPERFVRARGEVWADTWYELTAVCPPPVRGKGLSVGNSRRIGLKIGDRSIFLFGKSRNTLDGYDTIVHEYNLGLKGLFALPLSLLCETCTRRAPADAPAADLQAMRERLEAQLRGRIEGEIASLSFSQIEKDGAVYVTLRARCFENIAKRIQAGETSP